MKIKAIKEEAKMLQIEFDTLDLTIPDLIANELLKVSDVQFAGVSKDHPETGRPVLSIKTSKKSPKEEVIKALEKLDETISELKDQLSKKK